MKKQRIKWIASGVKYMGQPFTLIGEKRYDCRHGKDKNIVKKQKYHERRQVRDIPFTVFTLGLVLLQLFTAFFS